jgi:peroxiredoxin
MPAASTDTSLTAATTAMRETLRNQLPDGDLDILDRDAEALGRRDFAAAAPAVGDRAPVFRLPDARGGEVDLSSALAQGPVVLVFYRGAWCPYCNLQLAAHQAALDEIEATGATLIAVSPQTPDASLSFAEKQGLRFPVLSDRGNNVARAYGLVLTVPAATAAKTRELGIDIPAHNGDDSNELPAASTFVIGRDGTVLFASISGDYRWRVGPEEVLATLRGAGAS